MPLVSEIDLSQSELRRHQQISVSEDTQNLQEEKGQQGKAICQQACKNLEQTNKSVSLAKARVEHKSPSLRLRSPFRPPRRKKTVAFGKTVNFSQTIEAKDEERRNFRSLPTRPSAMNSKEQIKRLNEIVEQQNKEISELKNLDNSVRLLEATVKMNVEQMSKITDFLAKLAGNVNISDKDGKGSEGAKDKKATEVLGDKKRESGRLETLAQKAQNTAICDSKSSTDENKENENRHWQASDNQQHGASVDGAIDLERMSNAQRLFLPKDNTREMESGSLDSECWNLLKTKAEKNGELKRELVHLVMKHAGDNSLAQIGHSYRPQKHRQMASAERSPSQSPPRSYRTTRRTVTLAEEVTVRDSPSKSLHFSMGEKEFLRRNGIDSRGRRRSPVASRPPLAPRNSDVGLRKQQKYWRGLSDHGESGADLGLEGELENLYSDEEEDGLDRRGSPETRYRVEEYESPRPHHHAQQLPACHCRHQCYH